MSMTSETKPKEINSRLHDAIRAIDDNDLLVQPNGPPANTWTIKALRQLLVDAASAITVLRASGTQDEQYERLLNQRRTDLDTIALYHGRLAQIRKVLDGAR